jgi:hypothetical protein
MLRQKLIINIWLLHLIGFLSLHTLLTMHGHRNLEEKHRVRSWCSKRNSNLISTYKSQKSFRLSLLAIYA